MNLVEQKIQRITDIEAIRRLLVEYGRTLDKRDFEAYSHLFARDGEWIGVGTIGGAQGPQSIRAFMERNFGVTPARCNHLMTNMIIDVDGDSAIAWSRWILIDANAQDAPVLVYSGHYDDVLVREDGSWKFRKRVTTVDIPDLRAKVPPSQAG